MNRIQGMALASKIGTALFVITAILGSNLMPVSIARDPITRNVLSNGNMSHPSSGYIHAFNLVDISGFKMNSTDPRLYTISSLDGIVNSRSAALWIIYDAGYMTWTNELISSGLYNINTQVFSNVSAFVANYTSYVHGVILFDNSLPESVNVATPLCGIYKDVMVDKRYYANNTFPALANQVRFPIDVNLTADYLAQGFNSNTSKGQIYRWAFDKWGAQCNQTALGMLNVNTHYALRPYLAGRAIFTTWQPNQGNPKDPAADLATFDYILQNTPSDIIVLGWMGNDEGATVSDLSQHRKFIVASDFCKNLPFLQLLPLPSGYTYKQNRSTAQLPLEKKVYVAGIYSDGDNAQYDQNFMKEQLWDAPGCGNWPIGFELQMQLANLAPFIMYRYYQEETTNESFVEGVGGKGYVYWNQLPADFQSTFLSETLDLMNKTDMTYLRTWFETDFPGLVREIQSMPNASACKGILEGYVNNHPYTLPLVYGGMPVYIMTGMDRNSNGNDTADAYQKVLTLRPQDASGPVFLMLHLDAWNIPIAQWNVFCQMISRFSDVKVVGVDQFMDLLSRSQVGQAFTSYTVINLILAWGLVAVGALLVTKLVKGLKVKGDPVTIHGEA
ncbi:MAG TPA: hypothetical protein VKM55_04705 [Candidatus Lokiarchaeia archaeon]|nr:hypothetical protein [Candidatus Lokiarchaeia archaeon]